MARDRRRDPFKNFNFRLLMGALLGGFAALGIVRKLLKAKRNPPGVYIEEVPTGARPIEGVGTSTAGFVGTAPKQARASARRNRSRP